MRAQTFMTSEQSQMYDLGRQARIGGFYPEACNLATFDSRRFYWLAGWHDQDAEIKAHRIEEELANKNEEIL